MCYKSPSPILSTAIVTQENFNLNQKKNIICFVKVITLFGPRKPCRSSKFYNLGVPGYSLHVFCSLVHTAPLGNLLKNMQQLRGAVGNEPIDIVDLHHLPHLRRRVHQPRHRLKRARPRRRHPGTVLEQQPVHPNRKTSTGECMLRER